MKDRVTYESQALYVGPTETGTFGSVVCSGLVPTELQRVQGIEHLIDTNREQVYQLGSFNSLGTLMPRSPTVNLEFSYVLGDAQNEKWLGFDIANLTTPAISGFISGINDEQHFYIVTKKRGDIATTDSVETFLSQEDMSVYSFGNGVIENYSIEASLTDIPMATVRINATNMAFASGCSGIPSPGIDGSGCAATGTVIIPPARRSNLDVDSLRPSNITLNFGENLLEIGGPILPGNTGLGNLSTCSLESFSVNLDLERRESQTLGSRYTVLKKIDFPTEVTFDCVAKVRDIVSGNLINAFCSGSQDIVVQMDNPNTSLPNMQLALKSAHLQTEIFDHTLATNEIVNLTFQAPLSDGITGFYISGVAAVPQQTTYGITQGQLTEGVLGDWGPEYGF